MSAPKPEDLVGGWRLRRWEVVYPDGRRTQPLGPGASGLILYTPDGYMSAAMQAAGRTPFNAPNPRGAPLDARARAHDTFFGYAGRWRLDGARLVHDVEVALNPGMVGSVQVRDARLAGRELELSATEPLAGGGERVHRIVWARDG